MSGPFDVIVVGLGAVGSATAWQLARRGARVLGLDRFSPPHDRGSSHGSTRITRLAVGEGPQYVPLVRRSHQIWREIEAATGQPLFQQTGGVVIGAPAARALVHGQDDFVGQTIEIARRHDIAHELLDPDQLRSRFPGFVLGGEERCYFEPEAGFLRPEACVAAQLTLARQAGAHIRVNEAVLGIEGTDRTVHVRTSQGAYSAAQCIVSAGAWVPGLMGPPFAGALRVQRQTLFWFDADDAGSFMPGRFPVFIWVHGPRTADAFYGFPTAPGPAGVKIGTEQDEIDTDPDAMERSVLPEEAATAYAWHVRGRLAGVSARLVAAAACPYTVAPQSRFLIARAPSVPRAIVVSACSGHGFKHSAGLGEALAQQVLDGGSVVSLAAFGLGS